MLQQNFKKNTKYSVKFTLMNKKLKLIKYSNSPIRNCPLLSIHETLK